MVPPQPQPEIGVAQVHQKALTLLHPPEVLTGDGSTGGDSCGETGVGGLVPQLDPCRPGLGTDLLLGDATLPQRRADPQLLEGPHAGRSPASSEALLPSRTRGKPSARAWASRAVKRACLQK